MDLRNGSPAAAQFREFGADDLRTHWGDFWGNPEGHGRGNLSKDG